MTTVASWSDARSLLSDVSDSLFDAGMLEASWSLLLDAFTASVAHYRGDTWEPNWLNAVLGGMAGSGGVA